MQAGLIASAGADLTRRSHAGVSVLAATGALSALENAGADARAPAC